ncbi:Uncharacterised protein [uncultured archaeon]|nr:Uncharacterised protein [uncultured archaeon]
MPMYAKWVSACTTAMISSCSSASRISILAPSDSKSDEISGSHLPVFPSTGVKIMVWPFRADIVGPNMGCVPSTSTPFGA